MGLADIGSRILVEFKGDVSDLKSKLKELQGEEKKLAQAQLDAANARNKGLEQWADKLGKTGLALDGIEKISKLVGNTIGGTAKSMLEATANGAAMGSTFGPLGTVIGGVGGALVGLIKVTNQQTEAEKRAAEAAKKHADELQRIIDGETKMRALRHGQRDAVEVAEEELNQARLNATKAGLSQDSPDVERARRELMEAKAELEALNRSDGVIWLEQRKRDLERVNSIKDIEAARRSGIITATEADRRLKDLNKTEADSTDIVGQMRRRHEETAEAVAKLNKQLQAGQITTKEYTEALRAADEDYRKRDDERKKREEDAIKRAKEYRKEIAKLASKNAKESTDALVAELEGTPSSVVDLNGGAFAGLIDPDKLSAQLDFRKALQSQLGAYGSDGFVDEVAKYSSALQRFSDIAGGAYETIASGNGSVLQAIKSMAQAQLLSLGKLEIVEAIRELGLGFGALANPLFAGAAAIHFKSAAVHGAAAAAAGLGVAAIGALGGGSGTGGASNSAPSTANLGATPPRQQTTTQTIYIVQGDSFSEDSPRMRQRKAERVVALGSARANSVTGDF